MQVDVHEYNRILPLKQAVENKLLALPGVTGVDVGLKEVGDQATTVYAILVFVERKGMFRPEHRIPDQISGVPTDVIQATFVHQATPVTTVTAPAIDTKRYDPVQGGSCIMPARINNAYGSLGMIVLDATTRQQLWLSAYHVLCVDNTWNNPGVDTRVVQPAVAVGGNPATDTIGNVTRGKYGQIVVDWGYDLYVDCAVCTVTGRAASSNIVLLGTPKGAANATLNDLVQKYGATTELTWGSVVSTNFTIVVKGTTFYYQYRIGPAFSGGPAFSDGGDSGAVTVNSSQQAIGIVIAGDAVKKISAVNPMGQIIDALSITVPG
jgi:hypothetical protein